MKRILSIGVIIMGLAFSAIFAQNKYSFDLSHSALGFEVKHMVISTVDGKFKKFDGSLEFDGKDPLNIKVNVAVDMNSIDTDEEKRDGHLKSPDFFDVANYPTATFVSKKVVKKNDKYEMIGDLTLKGVTKEIAIPFAFNGSITDPWGNTRVGFEGSTVINRKDFGVTWNKTMDNGGLVVGNEVKLKIHLEAILQK
ncbi:MAG: YceI family protein [Calditrichia bacterium]